MNRRYQYKAQFDETRINDLFSMIRDIYPLEGHVEDAIREVRKSIRFEKLTATNQACDAALKAFQQAYQTLVDIEAALDDELKSQGL